MRLPQPNCIRIAVDTNITIIAYAAASIKEKYRPIVVASKFLPVNPNLNQIDARGNVNVIDCQLKESKNPDERKS